jgi:hypothetical protein
MSPQAALACKPFVLQVTFFGRMQRAKVALIADFFLNFVLSAVMREMVQLGIAV